ncbi:hypothetical protein EV426DRAFT_611394 [Tirmania nivea]|nr:hypothetical protein EV426DRAFT_611394 [Tirmania nivea]
MSNPSANPTLYGHCRPKSKPIPISHSSIHSLSTELSLAKQRLSTDGTSTSSDTTPGRPRGLKTKSLFAGSNKGVSSRAAKDLLFDDDRPSSKSRAAEGSGLTDAEFARSKRKMEEKAKIYEKLRKGEFITSPKKQGWVGGIEGHEEERLVDFDRKWRDEESGSGPNNSDSESENSEDEIGPAPPNEEIVEYMDEFGRTRTAPKSIAEKHMRKLKEAEEGGLEVRNSDDKPNPNLIYGSIIQTHAFTTNQFSSLPAQLPKVEDLPQTQPEAEEKHYDANAEIRTKGVGFYAFSGDNEQRKKQMEELMQARRKTEEERKKKEEGRKRRREEIEARREEIRRKKREIVGGRWLEGLMEELEAGGRKEGETKDEGEK